MSARNKNSSVTARHALHGKAVEVERHIIRVDFNPVSAAEASNVRRQIIRAGLADDE